MANFYIDNKHLKFHLLHPLMKQIISLRERNFIERDNYDYAPLDFEDTMDSYDKVLEIVGEICGNIIAENADSVDREGPHIENNEVKYASGTQKNYEVLKVIYVSHRIGSPFL